MVKELEEYQLDILFKNSNIIKKYKSMQINISILNIYMENTKEYLKKYFKYKKKYLNLIGGAKICNTCTFENIDSQNFCEVCGSKLSSTSTASLSPIQQCSELEVCGSKLSSASVASLSPIQQYPEFEVIPLHSYQQKTRPHIPIKSSRRGVYTKLEKIFYEKEWEVLVPRGDGKCLLYSILGYFKISPSPDLNIFVSTQIQKFFELKQETELLFVKSNGKIITINKTDSPSKIISKVEELLDDDNLSERIIDILSKSLNINILTLTRDQYSEKPYLQTYYESEQPDPRYLILINIEGHFFTVSYSKNTELIIARIHEILAGRLWLL